MSVPEREMTLEEVMSGIPIGHQAQKEYQKLLADAHLAVTLAKRVDDVERTLNMMRKSVDNMLDRLPGGPGLG